MKDPKIRLFERLLSRDSYNGNDFDVMFCDSCHEFTINGDINQKDGDLCKDCNQGVVHAMLLVPVKEVRKIEESQ